MLKKLNFLLHNKLYLLIFVILFFGLIYRLLLSSFAPHFFAYDMYVYHYWATSLLDKQMVIDCCGKNVGYSVFLSFIYLLFGKDNFFALRLIQGLIDLTSGILVYLLAKDIFNRKIALYSFLIYIINPFTAAYTGLLLPETLTIFFFTLIAYLIVRPQFTSKTILWILLGITLGLLLFTRLQFLSFCFIVIFLLMMRFKTFKSKCLFVGVTLLFFLLASSYTLFANYREYKAVRLTPPYDMLPVLLYLHFYNDRYPELAFEFASMNPTYAKVTEEFRNLAWSLDKIPAFKKYYQQLFWEKLATDYPLFFRNMLKNMVWMWDKKFLFPYIDPFYPTDTIFLRGANTILIVLSALGIIGYIIADKSKHPKKPITIFTLLVLIYMTGFLSLVTNETRHTLFFYAIFSLWAGYGVYKLAG